jgi:hypothetical protein
MEQIAVDEQGIIDIQRCREAVERDKTVTVMLNEKQGFEIRVNIRKQEKLLKRYVNPQIQFDERAFNQTMAKILQAQKNGSTQEAEIESIDGTIAMGGQEDYFGLALALVEFFEDWVGFAGKFNKQDARWFLENFSDLAKGLGRNFRDVLTEYQKAHTIYQDVLEKN